MNTVELHNGDCLAVLMGMPSDSIDAIVTDPPYGLAFMGKRWDYDVPSVEIWAECLRVLKPGGHLLAFAGTRTQHRMAVRIEDAGFEIRDMIAWVYGSGFPKSHNGPWGGTALKPALEPITVARKPLAGTVASNFAEHGTAGLNIDGCRVPHGEDLRTGAGTTWDAMHRHEGREGEASAESRYADKGGTDFAMKPGPRGGDAAGRWPANLIHDGSAEVLSGFPQAKGQQGAVGPQYGDKESVNAYGDFGARQDFQPRGDTGSAARFFYCAKASRKDRNEGCEGMEQKMPTAPNGAENAVSANRGSRSGPRENHHPTVKPTDLMRYLCRLVTPPGGVVLDPFIGSGSTGKAAVLEGFRFIGIEREAEYVEIARARIEAVMPKPEPPVATEPQLALFP